MSSPLLNQLAEKVRLVAAEIHRLRQERERLLAEVALMEEENRRSRRLLREHGELVAERAKTCRRLEKILVALDGGKAP